MKFSPTWGSFQRTGRFENYVTGWHLFGNKTFGDFFINSFVFCGLAVLGNLISCSLAAYAFARLKFRLKWFWFALMLGTLMLPIHAQLIPQYIFFLNIGWVNTILPLVVPKFLAHGRLLRLPDGAVHALAAARARAGGNG